MKIKGNEYKAVMDWGSKIAFLESLGETNLAKFGELFKEAQKNPNDIKSVKIILALIGACFNRWAQINEKEYSLTESALFALTETQIQQATKIVMAEMTKAHKGIPDKKKVKAEG